jgi:hypothetical protein
MSYFILHFVEEKWSDVGIKKCKFCVEIQNLNGPGVNQENENILKNASRSFIFFSVP